MIKGIAAQTIPAVRCAIYTRKSTDENLDSDFNSLDAQRESAENYVKSQSHERWIVVTDRYDDGAYSGATLERPALQRLLRDIDAGKIDVGQQEAIIEKSLWEETQKRLKENT